MGHGHGPGAGRVCGRPHQGASRFLPGTSWEEHWPGFTPLSRATHSRPMLSKPRCGAGTGGFSGLEGATVGHREGSSWEWKAEPLSVRFGLVMPTSQTRRPTSLVTGSGRCVRSLLLHNKWSHGLAAGADHHVHALLSCAPGRRGPAALCPRVWASAGSLGSGAEITRKLVSVCQPGPHWGCWQEHSQARCPGDGARQEHRSYGCHLLSARRFEAVASPRSTQRCTVRVVCGWEAPPQPTPGSAARHGVGS